MPRGLKISANRQRDGQTDRGRQTDAHGVAKRLRQHRVGLSVSIVELSSVSSSMISRSAVSLAQSTGYFYSSSRAPCSYTGVTRNSPAPGQISNSSPSPASLQWRSQKFLTGGASICSIPFCPFPFSCPMRRPVTLRNHIPTIMYFPDRGCVRP